MRLYEIGYIVVNRSRMNSPAKKNIINNHVLIIDFGVHERFRIFKVIR